MRIFDLRIDAKSLQGIKASNFVLSHMKASRIYEDEYVHMEIRDEILYFSFKPDALVDLSVAKEIVRQRELFCNGKAFPALIQDAGLKQLDKDARDFLSGPEGTKNIKAGAMVASNQFNRFIGNFVLRITHDASKTPARLFDSVNEAIDWLGQFK